MNVRSSMMAELAPFAPLARAALRRLLRSAALFGFIIALATIFDARAAEPAKPAAVATISILADFVRAVAGDTLVVESVVPVGGDPHTYEPVPSDARRLASAAIVFRNGLGLERWLDKLIGEARPDRPVVTLTEGFASLRVTEGAYAGDPDPHAWMDPHIAVRYVDAVERSLRTLYPRHAATYAANAARYREQLDVLDRDIRALMNSVPQAQRQLVTTHDAFRYFARRYGLNMVASIWGISTETEPSAREVARIVGAIRKSGVPAVFVETTINPKLMQRIAAEARVRIGEPLYGDSVGAPGSGAASYLGMMRANAQAIARGLSGPGHVP
ncbi:metal ABC transporter solute-binding protein, Zn/Mn family [Piscinibacter sp.]|uniref:metal ABC transporter solute-binding protein, Zn/Mn family n=1 Tax=Piscinibacter sp. TaxID=1903157 RepID=UPI002C337294|nr:zinc ABC transporter substrate-binding protein [Albitalea sp.]HUG24690.1 zinc ABC transporter substrate-binding protein [Albitalea sp.]